MVNISWYFVYELVAPVKTQPLHTMDGIYCLIFTGTPLSNGIRDLLFKSAQDLMRENSRKKRISEEEAGLNGQLTTSYKLGMLGSACGFIFTAEMDWDEGSTKIQYIVRPVRQKFLDEKMKDMKWVTANSDFIPESDPWRN